MPLKEGPTNRFTLECQVKAVPEAKIKWFKNGEEIIHQQINGIDISNPETLDFTSKKTFIFTQILNLVMLFSQELK